MYEEFYGLSRLPFQLLPDPDLFYRSKKHDKALTYLEYGVFERAGFIVITGEVGTGKTTLLRYLLRSLKKDIPTALLNQTFLPPVDFLRMLCQEFSLPYEAKGKSELIELFGKFLVDQYQQGRYVILILDEAQNLPLDTLEEIRMLSNLDADSERLLQIILVGQPSLRSKLLREELRQLFQRIEVSYHLDPLDREELQKYIHHRLKAAGAEDPDLFDKSVIEAIYESTDGIPRLINLVCHRCLVYGFADGLKKITRDLLEKMLADLKTEGLYPQGKIESSTQNGHMTIEPSDIKENSGSGISQADLAATLNRLSEISGDSMKAVELAATKAAKMSGEANFLFLKKQLADEKELREALEHRLNRTEDDLARLVKAPTKIYHEDQEQISADNETSLGIQKRKGFFGFPGVLFSFKMRRHTLFLLVLIMVIFLFSSLALWRPKGSKIHEQPSEPEPQVLKYEKSLPIAKKESIKPDQTPTVSPSTAETKSVAHNSDVAAIAPSEDSNSQTDSPSLTGTPRNDFEGQLLPLKPTARNLNAWEPGLVTGKYVCIVKLANVRAAPSTKAAIVYRIAEGTVVEVIRDKGKWMQLKNQDGQSAWIYKTLLRRKD